MTCHSRHTRRSNGDSAIAKLRSKVIQLSAEWCHPCCGRPIFFHIQILFALCETRWGSVAVNRPCIIRIFIHTLVPTKISVKNYFICQQHTWSHCNYFTVSDCYVRHAVAWLVDALCYKPEGSSFKSWWDHGIFNLSNPSNRTIGLGSSQPLTEMSTRNLPEG
jgi:hypothetical protein